MRELISELKSQNIYLSLDRDELVIDFDEGDLSDDLISRIKANKGLLIDYLKKYTKAADYSEIPSLPLNTSYPLSSGQLRLWMQNQLEGGSATYNMPFQAHLDQAIDTELFARAVDAVI